MFVKPFKFQKNLGVLFNQQDHITIKNRKPATENFSLQLDRYIVYNYNI